MVKKLQKHTLDDYKSDVTKQEVMASIDKACLFKVTRRRVFHISNIVINIDCSSLRWEYRKLYSSAYSCRCSGVMVVSTVMLRFNWLQKPSTEFV